MSKGESHNVCTTHYTPEPVTPDTYRVCFGCNHVFETPSDLEAAYDEVVNGTGSWDVCVPEDDDAFSHVEVESGPMLLADEIHACPYCTKGF